ncbi:MAG: hypothetical protein ACLSWI_07115 [Candidatus Gastranaerophilaceae bacterium]
MKRLFSKAVKFILNPKDENCDAYAELTQYGYVPSTGGGAII